MTLAVPATWSLNPTAISAYPWLDGGNSFDPFYAYNPAGKVSAGSPATGAFAGSSAALYQPKDQYVDNGLYSLAG